MDTTGKRHRTGLTVRFRNGARRSAAGSDHGTGRLTLTGTSASDSSGYEERPGYLSAGSYGTWVTVALNSPTAPGKMAATPKLKWPGVDGIPELTSVNGDEPGKIPRHASVNDTGVTFPVPVMRNVPPVPVHAVRSRLS